MVWWVTIDRVCWVTIDRVCWMTIDRVCLMAIGRVCWVTIGRVCWVTIDGVLEQVLKWSLVCSYLPRIILETNTVKGLRGEQSGKTERESCRVNRKKMTSSGPTG